MATLQIYEIKAVSKSNLCIFYDYLELISESLIILGI